MCSSTEFLTEIPHTDHPDLFSVFLFKEGERPHFSGPGQRSLNNPNRQVIQNSLINLLLYPGNLIIFKGRKMIKIKAKSIRSNQRAGLVTMLSQYRWVAE